MAKITGPRKLYRYTDDFKLKAVKLTQLQGVQVKHVAEALEIHPWMLSKWRTQAASGAFAKASIPEIDVSQQQEIEELARVKQELALLKEEHELLKKAIRFCSERRTTSLRS